MRTHFSHVFWGLLLVVLDFSINGFDVLVDGLGYVLVALGCGGLASLSSQFATARTLGFVLAIMWLVGFAVSGDLAMVYGLATTVVNCVMIWQLLGGIAEFAVDRERLDLTERAINRRLAYVVVIIASSLVTYFMHGSIAGPIVIVLVVAGLVVIAMILHLVHRVKVELVT